MQLVKVLLSFREALATAFHCNVIVVRLEDLRLALAACFELIMDDRLDFAAECLLP
jgi:hypothetical protein